MMFLWAVLMLASFVAAFGADPPKPPPPQPPPDTGAADAAAAAEAEKARRRKGAGATRLTSPVDQERFATLGGAQQESAAANTTKAKLGA